MQLINFVKRLQVESRVAIPLRSKEKIPLAGSSWKGRSAPLSDEEISLIESQNLNVGILNGKINNNIVIDIDPKNGGIESFQKLEEELGSIKDESSYVVQTGSGGYHIYFLYPEGEMIPSRILRQGIDLKSDGGYVVS